MKKSDKPVPAARILRDVLNLHSSNSNVADSILRSILGKDPRFCATRGGWSLGVCRSGKSGATFEDAATLFMESGMRPGCIRGALHLRRGDRVWQFQKGETAIRTDSRTLREARRRLHNRILLVWSPKDRRLWNYLLRCFQLPEWQDDSLCLRELSARVLRRAAHGLRPEDLARVLGLPDPDPDDPARMARFLSSCLPLLLSHVPAESATGLRELTAWIESAQPKVDFASFGFSPEFLLNLPESPGVYLMRDKADEVIYVGKARNLRRRVRSYFTAGALRDPKVVRIHERLYDIDVVLTKSEVEALLLEMRLIRDLSPSINLQAEIHRQRDTRDKKPNLVLLVPERGGRGAELYFLRDGIFIGQYGVPLGRGPSTRIQHKIRSCYFTRKRVRKQAREPWEIELVLRWLAINRNRLNYVDVDEAGSIDSMIARLTSYLNDPGRLEEKVYYR
ncbi:MAG TPA: nucleotide excision repair endonuclease [Acidobacteriota bacterium]|nr:nucleotide excision repair endonuclease [Acidobacteriota bacterium]